MTKDILAQQSSSLAVEGMSCNSPGVFHGKPEDTSNDIETLSIYLTLATWRCSAWQQILDSIARWNDFPGFARAFAFKNTLPQTLQQICFILRFILRFICISDIVHFPKLIKSPPTRTHTRARARAPRCASARAHWKLAVDHLLVSRSFGTYRWCQNSYIPALYSVLIKTAGDGVQILKLRIDVRWWLLHLINARYCVPMSW